MISKHLVQNERAVVVAATFNLRRRNRCPCRGCRCPLRPRRPHPLALQRQSLVALQRLFDLRRDFVHQFGVVRKRALQPLATLSEFRSAVAVPRTTLFDDFEVHAQIGHFAQARDAHTESDFEFALLERRRHLVLHDFHLRVETHHFVAVFDLRAATDVEAHRRVELQGVTTGGRFGTAKHHADFFRAAG